MDKQEQYLNRVLENLKGETVIDVRVDIDNERVIHFKYPFQDEIKRHDVNKVGKDQEQGGLSQARCE